MFSGPNYFNACWYFPFGEKRNIQNSYYFSLEIFVQLNADAGIGTV